MYYLYIFTWNLFVPYFGASTLQNKVFSNQNRGHLGSRYIYRYLYTFFIFLVFCFFFFLNLVGNDWIHSFESQLATHGRRHGNHRQELSEE